MPFEGNPDFHAVPEHNIEPADDRLADELTAPAVGLVPIMNPLFQVSVFWLEMSFAMAGAYYQYRRR